MLWAISSCVPDDLTEQQIVQSELVGHWDVTTLSGLMFVEFTPDNRVLIHDRGALGPRDQSAFYFQDYAFSDHKTIEGLPDNSRMTAITVLGDQLSFVLENPTTGYRLQYFGERVEKISQDAYTQLLSKTWVTVEENGIPLQEADQKLSYFSNTGLFMIKEKQEKDISLFAWQWTTENQICYTEYQRPRLLPDPICMSFVTLSEDIVEFIVDHNLIKLEPTVEF
jgi:hypothetical protein